MSDIDGFVIVVDCGISERGSLPLRSGFWRAAETSGVGWAVLVAGVLHVNERVDLACSRP